MVTVVTDQMTKAFPVIKAKHFMWLLVGGEWIRGMIFPTEARISWNLPVQPLAWIVGMLVDWLPDVQSTRTKLEISSLPKPWFPSLVELPEELCYLDMVASGMLSTERVVILKRAWLPNGFASDGAPDTKRKRL